MQNVHTWITDEIRAKYESQGLWTTETWWDLFLAGVERDPGALAVADETREMTRAEVRDVAERIGAFLWHQGLRPGDVVTVCVPNWWELVALHAAVGRIGCVFNPILPILEAPEIRHVLKTAGSSWVFATNSYRGRTPAAAADEARRGLDHVLGLTPVRSGELQSLEDLLNESWESRVTLPEAPIDPRGADIVLFTSGTESAPKGVVHSHQTSLFDLKAYVNGVLELTAEDVIFMPSPVCHASGLQWGLRASILAGAPLILQDRWNGVKALSLINQYGCTYSLAATPFIVDLIAAHDAAGGGGETLRYVASGGAPIPRHLVSEVRRAFDAPLLAVFGSSETFITTATIPGDTLDQLRSDGRPLPGIDLRIADAAGEESEAGVEGEILTRGPHVFVGYLGDADLTDRAFTEDWYRFGDLGTVDPSGCLHVTGRIKDIVIRGGENISVREVEELLADYAAIRQVAIIGVPDTRLGERCCAVVTAADSEPPTLEGLVAHLTGKRVAKYKLPEHIVVLETLPMTATGKVQKAQLRKQLAGRFK